MTAKDEKVDIKNKASEIDYSQSNFICLTRKESERFVGALQNVPKANEKLKQLFKKHSI